MTDSRFALTIPFLDCIIEQKTRRRILTMKLLTQLGPQRLVSGLIIGLFLLSVFPIGATAQGTLTFSLHRDFGTAFGNSISGTFSLSGSGPDTIQNLTVYFNDTEVDFVEGNSINWQFHTGDYPSGATNITLIGIDNTGETYTASASFVFLSGSTSNTITILIIALTSILVLVAFGVRVLRLRKK